MMDFDDLVKRLRDFEEIDEGKINDARFEAADAIEALRLVLVETQKLASAAGVAFLEGQRDAALASAEKADKERGEQKETADHLLNIEQEWIDENNRLADECKRLAALLREAGEVLEPFAEQCTWEDDWSDGSDCAIEVKLIDLRRTRAMLAKIKGEPTDSTDDGQPDESQEWRDFDPDC